MPGTLGAAGIRRSPSALALVLFGPPPGDLPAHLYRTELVRDGVLVWDTFWYAGHYPLLGYSLLYYFPAALVGNDLVALVSVVAAAALFASLAEREWGRPRAGPRGSSRSSPAGRSSRGRTRTRPGSPPGWAR